MTFASTASNFSENPAARRHPPSQFVTDEDGLKWRLCAGAAVFNSKNQLLIGERISKPGSWQAPQGGVDGRSDTHSKLETPADAAVRELYEEIGLENGVHVLLEQLDDDMPHIKCRYSTAGTGSWLEKEGLAGQELNWIIFRCADSNLERNPSLVCRLNGLNGEAPEFSAVRWESLDWVIDNVWEQKVRPYEVLKEACVPMMKRWDEQRRMLGFQGRWSRDSNRSVGVAEGLIARGVSEKKALKKAEEPYVQYFEQSESDKREWRVTTYDVDGVTPRRNLLYSMGDFEEAYDGTSTLFGGSDGGVVKRCCFYLARADADDQIAHVAVSETPRGLEEAMRYLKDGNLILRRTFWHSWSTEKVLSTEVFSRC